MLHVVHVVHVGADSSSRIFCPILRMAFLSCAALTCPACRTDRQYIGAMREKRTPATIGVRVPKQKEYERAKLSRRKRLLRATYKTNDGWVRQ